MAEQWRPVVGLEDLYMVSDQGRVVRIAIANNTHVGRLLSLRSLLRGYPSVDLGGHTRYVHALVLEAFHGPRPSGYECNHLNGVKADNRSENLEWISHEENVQHARKLGLVARGERHCKAKLTEDAVRYIREYCTPGVAGPFSQCGLARRFGVSSHTIYCVANRQTWKHVK